MEYEIYPVDELYHHGVIGMKWGIRRYQRKDGSLTSAGKKHRVALERKSSPSKSASKNSKRVSKSKTVSKAKTTKNTDANAKPKQKSVSEMTDSEVRDRINRMMLEKQYYDTRRSLAASNPQQVSKGKKFMDSVLNDVLAPAAKEAGRKWMTNFMEEKMGLNKKTELQRLEDTWKKLDYKKKISDLQKGIKENYDTSVSDIEKQWKILDYTKKIKDLESPKDDGFDLADALRNYRDTSDDERELIQKAAKFYEDLDKIRKKGKTKD